MNTPVKVNSKKLTKDSLIIKRKISKKLKEDEEKSKYFDSYLKINSEIVIIYRDIRNPIHSGNVGDTGIVISINTFNTSNRIYNIKLDINNLNCLLEYQKDFVLLKDFKGEIITRKTPERLAIDRFINSMSYSGSTNSCGVKEINSVHGSWNSHIEPAMLKSEESRKIILDYLRSNFISTIKQKCGPFAHIMISMPSQSNKTCIDLMEELCHSTTLWKRNPNSGNEIKVWLLS